MWDYKLRQCHETKAKQTKQKNPCIFKNKFRQLYFFFHLFILFFNFTILYWFCHISTWICHRYTRVPHPESSSFLPPPSPYHPSGSSQCTSPKHPVLCTILASTCQLLCRMSLNWVYLVFFSCLNWGYWFTEGRSQSNIPISLHHIQDTHHQHDYRWWYWPWSPGHSNSCQVFTL